MRPSTLASASAELAPARAVPLPFVRSSTRASVLSRPDGRVGVVLLVLTLALAIIAPLFVAGDPFALTGAALSPPTMHHPMGTDALGRDVWTGVVHGGRASLLIAAAVVIVAVAMVYIASFAKGYFATEGLTMKVMTYVGERSYSMYLTHMLSLTSTRELCVRIFGRVPHDVAAGVGLSLFALALTAILSEFSYRFIEEPFREKGRRLAENLAT